MENWSNANQIFKNYNRWHVVMSRLPVKPPPWAVTPAVFCGRGLVRGGNQWLCFALKKACGFVSAEGSNKKSVPVLLVTPAKSSHVSRLVDF
jgi:hypothetical protein